MNSPQNQDQKAFRVIITVDHRRDIVICVTHPLAGSSEFTAFNYYKLFTAIDAASVPALGSGTLSFTQELRHLDRAHRAHSSSIAVADVITGHIKEAYGQVSSMKIENLTDTSPS